MKLRQPLAVLGVSALAAGGLVAGAGAAQAAPVPSIEHVLAADLKKVSDTETESDIYNDWHFDPSKAQEAAQARNGLVAAGGVDTTVIKGNGNDVAETAQGPSVVALAESLQVVSSDPGKVFYQIPLRLDSNGDGVWTSGEAWTTLRAPSSDSTVWTTSRAIAGYGAHASATLEQWEAAFDGDAFPIGAGFHVDKTASGDVLVSSFTADGVTTRFYAENVATPAAPATEYVTAADIRPNEESYPGWHESVEPGQEATRGTFETVAGEGGATLGLRVTGKSQLINGFAPEDFQRNAAGFAAAMTVDAAEGGAAIFTQVPVFYYPEGQLFGEDDAPRFTTLRAPVAGSGAIGSAGWVSSADIVDGSGGVLVPRNTAAPLDDIVAALGQHDVLAYGFTVDGAGAVATVESVSFNGTTTAFTKAADPVDPVDPEEPKPPVEFADVTPDTKFSKEITWMAERGLSTGIKKTDASGKVYYDYEPKSAVTREAMAAFLYRLEAPKNYRAPKVSPFADVKPGDKFYTQIAWMYDRKLSTGIKQASGKPHFAPKSKITREAMAAFMNRANADRSYTVPKVSPFADVRPSDQFYAQIAWMFDSGLSTGIKQDSGKPTYAPKSSVTREAMAAFLYRGDKL
ncbi:S-layer homology domain-containing protein [Leucobacter sp.]